MALLKTSSLLLLLGLCTFGHAAVSLSPANRQLLLDQHNTQRASVGASNMLAMVWNNTLANMVANFLDSPDFTTQCIFPPLPFDPTIGLNQFTFPDTKANLTAAVLKWVQSKVNYTYSNNSCNDFMTTFPPSCYTYIQVVWSEGNQLGCDYRNCTPPGGSPRTTLVCYYSPQMPFPVPPLPPTSPIPQPYSPSAPEPLPFLIGKPCTKCSTGQFLCSLTGLCNQTCSTCACKADCKNCGKLTSTTDCRCQCPVGRTGVDCSGPCNNTLDVCGMAPFWDLIGCTDGQHPWVPYYCPAVCPVHTCAPSKCPRNFTFYDGRYTGNDTNTGSCYAAFFEPVTQSQAATNCSTLTNGKGRLAYIETQQELSAIVEYLSIRFPDQQGNGAYWIGGCRKNASHNDPMASFVWSQTCTQGTGPSAGAKPFSYNNWNGGEPTNTGRTTTTSTTGEWCVEMFKNATIPADFPFLNTVWNDVDCNAQRGFYICETDPSC